ncbi:hypothetical protein GZH53_00630 [Flavihumibacter sp. R14]|nr:hypothetical protein [Flavihumibacter soli]
MGVFNTPLLFLIFNRPDTTKQVFDEIRKLKPKFLYLAADGPRSNLEGETKKCQLTQQIVLENIDWDCQVATLIRDENLGCGKAVSEAITWFFSHVEEGIILEDDCLPDASFFPFCSELLERYRSNQKVMTISGSNLLGKPWKSETQSYFCGHGGIWGWATWKRAWTLYDSKMTGWSDSGCKELIRANIKTNEWYKFYYHMFESSFNGSLDTWDVQWFYTILINNALGINPSVNLVKNIGFNNNATHTSSNQNFLKKLKLTSIALPLIHPKILEVDTEYLKLMYKAVTSQNKTWVSLSKERLKNLYQFLFKNLNKW